METSEDEEDLKTKILDCVQHKEWGMEGPSNPYVEVWEEL